MSAYMHWWGVQFDAASGSLISAGFGGAPQATSYLWAYAQWSRYVRPGAVRVKATSTAGTTISTSAFKNPDGSVSVQILNNGDTNVTISSVSVSKMTVGSAHVWFSDNANVGVFALNGTVLSSAGAISLTAPLRSMVSVVFYPSS